MLMDIVIGTQNITTTIFGFILTGIGTFISVKVTGYIKGREEAQKEAAELQRLHNMKLEAMVYAIISVGTHKDEIKEVYDAKLSELIKEEKYLKRAKKS